MVPAEIPWFRDLYNQILNYRGYSLFFDVLQPWSERAAPAVREFERFRTFSPFDPKDEPTALAMLNLYALGRVNDILLMSFQKHPLDRRIAELASHEYEAFYSQMGFTIDVRDSFSPFHHEIVQVHESSDADQPIETLERVWPGLMLGTMLFSRSGVQVSGGRNHVSKEIAEQSTLYFAYRRRWRKTEDLSRGWGSNSQWRTDWRRDYRINGKLIYNADGKHLLHGDFVDDRTDDGLTAEERIELCRHRCFIVSRKRDTDLWPPPPQNKSKTRTGCRPLIAPS